MFYNSSKSAGHYRAVTGYNQTGIFSHDPSKGGQYTGPNICFEDALFKDLWTKYRNWGLILETEAPSSEPLNPIIDSSSGYLKPSGSSSVRYGHEASISLDLEKGDTGFLTFILDGKLGLLTKERSTKDKIFDADFFLEECEKFKKLIKEKKELEQLVSRKTPYGGYYI